MSMHFITGLMGAGKSMYAVHKMIEELRLTKRNIATNLPLLMPDLCEYLHQQFGESFNAPARIRILTDSEVKRFWRHPGPGWDVEKDVVFTETEDGKKQVVPDFSVYDRSGGCLFIIDEIQDYFGARNWASVGPEAAYFVTKHRKLGVDILVLTQHPSLVDKQFRLLAQDFTELRNLSYEKLGVFRGANAILRQTFRQMPTATNEKPMCRAVTKIDVSGLGRCYNTAAGAGVLNRSADTKRVKTGLSLWWAIPCLILFGALIWGIPQMIYRFGVGGLKRLTGSSGNPAVAPAVVPESPVGQGAVEPPPSEKPALEPVRARVPGIAGRDGEEKPEQPLYVTGIAVFLGKARVYLSDGRRYTSDDSELTFLSQEFCIISGKKIPFKPANYVEPKVVAEFQR